ncbi:sugar/nucleoside kinase (ribokinase family) [Rhizobium sp. PP-F2F-G48]|uniref:carbohydrate kinase family protein n=1 Tax=Rhizobium sp. PP-F2F-G48 TaxID=2135651 RepID=UPI0010496637|nr:carbohydrate kinase family protein [Rhizobium sp. PP-F2F-G48]TCM58916.1 sugar/nucleoside kinase (ribokinase family) [Rhizobium sp. PP-F2F-G48]
MKTVVVFGGAHIDRRGRIATATTLGASHPGHWFEEAGGGGFNAARGLARLGLSVSMVAPRGGDAEGETVARAAEDAGVVDRSFTFLDRRTPSYTAILEADGNLVVALADMDLYTLFSPRRLRQRALRDLVEAAHLVLVDANLPAETLQAALRMAKAAGASTAAIAISPAKVGRLRPAFPHLDCLFLNEAEAAAIGGEKSVTAEGWPAILRAAGIAGGVVTRGGRAAVAFAGTTIATVRPPEIDALGDVTGAGDALAAGFLDAWMQGADLGACLRAGVAAAAITVRSPLAVADDLSPERLAQQLRLVSPAEILFSQAHHRSAEKDAP